MNAFPLYPEELLELLETAQAGVTQALELWATDEHDGVLCHLAARALRQYGQINLKLAQLCEADETEEARRYTARGLEAHELAEAVGEGRVRPERALEFGNPWSGSAGATLGES